MCISVTKAELKKEKKMKKNIHLFDTFTSGVIKIMIEEKNSNQIARPVQD